jgi:hypothetical protein
VSDVLQLKNDETRKLQSEVARVQALQEQLKESVYAKLKEYGLSSAELGFTPQTAKDNVKTQKMIEVVES